VIIVEDDITFLDPVNFKSQLFKFLHSSPKKFDVLLLGGNNIPPYKVIDETCVKVSRCQTTTGYLVQQHYYDTLIENFKEGVRGFMKYPEKPNQYAIDKFWFKLQQKDAWFLLTPLSVIQKAGYSDIEEKETDYSGMMMDLDKKTFFENIEKMRNRFKNTIYRV
jgi:GR25 family glycosyltransferase involved in LPS biosynthesis